MSGTVNIARSIFVDEAFKDQPYTEREAFMWLVMEASWKDRAKRIGSAVVDLKRGQLAASIRFMADAWGWEKSTVDRFLKRLEKRDMIGTDSGTGVSVVTIRKYNAYQGGTTYSGTEEKINRDSSGTAAGQTRIPEEIPEKKEEIGKPISPATEKSAPEPKARLPSDWALSDEGWAYARSQQIPDEVIHDEARGFHAYWSDRRDRDAKKSARGWEQCWANRCRAIAVRYQPRGGMAGKASPGGYGQGGSIASIAARRRASGAV